MWAPGRNAPLIRFLMSALYYCLLVCIMYHHKHQACKLNKEDAVDRCKWRKVIKEVRWPGWVWAGECFFWYRPTRVVPDKRPLNGCCCCCNAPVIGALEICRWYHLEILFRHSYFLDWRSLADHNYIWFLPSAWKAYFTADDERPTAHYKSWDHVDLLKKALHSL